MADRRRRIALLLGAGATAAEFAALRRRGYPGAGNVVVRCRQGHLFTTLWVPGVSLKSVRLGPWRVQRCPVGTHWSVVAPVRKSDLSAEELRVSAARRDIRIP